VTQSHDQQLAQKRRGEAVAAAELAAYVANIRFEDAKAAATGAARAAVAKQRAVDLACAPSSARHIEQAARMSGCGAVVPVSLSQTDGCVCNRCGHLSPAAASQPADGLHSASRRPSQCQCIVTARGRFVGSDQPPPPDMIRGWPGCRRDLKVQVEERENNDVVAEAVMNGHERQMNRNAVKTAESAVVMPHQVALR